MSKTLNGVRAEEDAKALTEYKVQIEEATWAFAVSNEERDEAKKALENLEYKQMEMDVKLHYHQVEKEVWAKEKEFWAHGHGHHF